MNRLSVFAGALISLAAMQSLASPIINNTGLAGSHTTITFSEFTFATDTPITNQFSSLGATFSPGYYYDTAPFFFPGDFLANFSTSGGPTHNPEVIQFNQIVDGAAFAMQTDATTSTFEALLGGGVVESFTAGTTLSSLPDLTHASDFFGFSGIAFDAIRVTSGSTFMQIDNLQIRPAQVPEPATLALLGLGLAGLGFSRRKK